MELNFSEGAFHCTKMKSGAFDLYMFCLRIPSLSSIHSLYCDNMFINTIQLYLISVFCFYIARLPKESRDMIYCTTSLCTLVMKCWYQFLLHLIFKQFLSLFLAICWQNASLQESICILVFCLLFIRETHLYSLIMKAQIHIFCIVHFFDFEMTILLKV